MTEIDQVTPKSGRPRSSTSSKAIVDATLDLLAEVGVGATSIEGIAARAGVAKTTIYRRWPDKESLICDAMAALKGPPPELPGTSLRDDLLTMANASVRGRAAARFRKLYGCFIGEMSRHPALDERYRKTVIEPRRGVVRDLLRRAVQRGELRDDLDVDVMIEVVTAPLLHWLLNHPDQTPSTSLVEQFVDGALDGLRHRG